jgi:3-dehydroquinate dehydratase-1
VRELRLGKHRLTAPAVCAAVMGENVEEMEKAAARAIEQGADLIELRFDSLKDREGWEGILRGNVPVIFTNRPKREGGWFGDGEQKRIDFLLEAVSRKVSCVDVELSTATRLRDRVVSEAKRSGVSVMMSYHDFLKTPPVERMIGLARRMVEAGCSLAKVVTFARSSADALRVLDFVVQVQDEVCAPVIAFAMGEAGVVTRIVAPLLGSPITYASAAEPTAPGQLDVETTKRLLCEFMEAGRKK